MGVQTRIVAFSPDKSTAENSAAAAFAEVDRLDGIMSDYRRGSELNRLSDAAGGPPMHVSDDLLGILLASQDIALSSGGAFDITVGPAVALWREARRSGHLPDEAVLARALALVGWDKLEVHRAERTARLKIPGMRLDLGGIAKGYAAERAVLALRARGLNRCLVSLAGDVFAGDPPPGQAAWRVEVEGEQGGGPTGVLLISNGAVSTSGDTAQFLQIDGRRFSHIIDPHTGLGLSVRRSVTISSPHGEWADALATAACILGPQRSRAMLAQYPGTAAVFQDKTDADVARTIIDPEHRLHWAAPVAPSNAAR